MKHRVISVALMLFLLVSSCIVILPAAAEEADVWDGSIASGFAGGDGSEKNPYIIETAEQLAFLAQSVNAGEAYEGKYFKLTSDLVLNEASFAFEADTGLVKITDGEHVGYLGTGVNGDDSGENTVFDKSVPRQGMWYDRETGKTVEELACQLQAWVPIGTQAHAFGGHFDGGGHVISGLFIFRDENRVGLFGNVKNAVLSDICVKNALILGTSSVGSVVGYGTGENMAVTGCRNEGIVMGNRYVGGAAGRVHVIANCQNNGVVLGDTYSITESSDVGGVVGMATMVQECINTGTVRGMRCVGGIAGRGTKTSECVNKGYVWAKEDLCGGIVGMGKVINSHNEGRVAGAGIVGKGAAENCYNTASAGPGIVEEGTATNCYNTANVGVAGIVRIGTAVCCYNTGDVSGVDYAAGIVGVGSAEYCYNTGDVTGYCGGGIVGCCGEDDYVLGCYNLGSVSGIEVGSGIGSMGGIVGDCIGKIKISECYNLGSITGDWQVGGIVGGASGSVILQNCYNAGTIVCPDTAGGIVGATKYSVDLRCCYNVGTINGLVRLGGLVGSNVSDADFVDCYYLSGCAVDEKGTVQYGIGVDYGTYTEDPTGISGLNAEEMKRQESYKGFDFGKEWEIGIEKGYDYPTLIKLHKDHIFDVRMAADIYLCSEASCQSAATYYYSCRCGMAGENTFLHGKSGHVTDTAKWQTDDAMHWHVCARCQKNVHAELHDFMIMEQTGEGLRMSCLVCNAQITASIAEGGGIPAGTTGAKGIFVFVYIAVGMIAGGLLVYGFIVVREVVRKRK